MLVVGTWIVLSLIFRFYVSSVATFKTAVNDLLTQQIDCTRFPAAVR